MKDGGEQTHARVPVVVVLGGGAAGVFAAIRTAEQAPRAKVILLEAAAMPLQKVRISGGGRCNVTHHQFDPAVLVTKYPRGAKELRGVLSRFGPREMMQWFEARGVALKTEPDGRVFPTTDDSETICSALIQAAQKAGVEVRTHTTITKITRELMLTLKGGDTLQANAVLLASGSNPHGLRLAQSVGHTVVPPVPSLFTFEVHDPRIEGLAGISIERVRAKVLVGDATFEQEGPLLITHWGFSAHAVLRLSAWGAREFHDAGYQARLILDLVPDIKEEALRYRAEALRRERPGATLGANPLVEEVPRRLWERLVEEAGGTPTMRWGEVPNRGIQQIVDELKRSTFQVSGKGPFREEFVTAGGVDRKEVDWRTMESKLVPGLFFAGEVLDVDALTGGYNLQNAWSTGWLAGGSMAARVGNEVQEISPHE
ncbi:MAG: NAD(P)/FAD-dependent oxidoreductase [Candidatus Thermoplasmatota archaeon]